MTSSTATTTHSQHTRANVIDRIPSDCPHFDPQLIDDVVRALDRVGNYFSNSLEPRIYPRSLDVEAVTAETLGRTWTEADNLVTRGHVSPYIDRLRRLAGDQDNSGHRWTVTTPETLALKWRIYTKLRDYTSITRRGVLTEVEANPT